MNKKEFIDAVGKQVNILLKAFDFNPEKPHSLDALREMEESINEIYPEGHQPLATTLIPFGFYLGETMAKNFDGHWDLEDKEGEEFNPFDMSVIIKSNGDSKVKIFPFNRVGKYWQNREDALSTVYLMQEVLRVYSPDQLQNMPADKDGWVEFGNGLTFRINKEEDLDDESKENLKKLV